MFGRRTDPSTTVDRVVADVRQRLVGREHDGTRVASVFHYGAVDLGTGNLVLWILLEGRPSDELPEWFPIVPHQPDLPAHAVDHGWLLGLRDEVVRAFRSAGWPDPESVRVIADSAERVDANGGWHYFK